MIIKNPSLLASCRSKGRCALCGKYCNRREGHHVLCRGMGGGSRLDVKIHLVCVGSTRTRECDCHSRIDTKEGRERCLRIVADREKCQVEDIEEALWVLIRLDGKASKYRITELVRALPEAVRKIVQRELSESGKL